MKISPATGPEPKDKASLLAQVRQVSAMLAENAHRVDATGEPPLESLAALRAGGLMGLTVPQALGGPGENFLVMAEVAAILAEGCTSTAMIWVMHHQQVATIADYAGESFRSAILPRILAGELCIASVTTEAGKGGDLLSAFAPLQEYDGRVHLVRNGPVVTGGQFAGGFLMTMRASAESSPSDVVLAYADRAQLEIKVYSKWQAMGMRGTDSIGLSMEGWIPSTQVIRPPRGFAQLAVSTMVPVGHIGFAAVWIGAARGAFKRLVMLYRDPTRRRSFSTRSDLFAERLARARLKLDTASAMLRSVANTYDELRARENLSGESFGAPWFNIQVNGLKVAASELSFEAIDDLVQLAGLRHGYLSDETMGVERVFRDLRSARLMYPNDKLLVMNGKFALLDREVNLA